MPKGCHNDFLDGAFSILSENCKRIAIVSTTMPSTISSASTALYFAINSITSADFSVSDDSTNTGRKCVISAQSTIGITSTGVAGHICLFSTGASGQIYYWTSCTTQALASTANKVTIPAWTINLPDPT